MTLIKQDYCSLFIYLFAFAMPKIYQHIARIFTEFILLALGDVGHPHRPPPTPMVITTTPVQLDE